MVLAVFLVPDETMPEDVGPANQNQPNRARNHKLPEQIPHPKYPAAGADGRAVSSQPSGEQALPPGVGVPPFYREVSTCGILFQTPSDSSKVLCEDQE